MATRRFAAGQEANEADWLISLPQRCVTQNYRVKVEPETANQRPEPLRPGSVDTVWYNVSIQTVTLYPQFTLFKKSWMLLFTKLM